MRITLKKVLVYICSVCIIDSVILCIYVSSNRDKRTEFLQRAADSSRHDGDDRTYFINEPHFERLIKEYRNQEEEYPRRVLFQNDDRPSSDGQLTSNNNVNENNQRNTALYKVNPDAKLRKNENAFQTFSVQQSVENQHGGNSRLARGSSPQHSVPTIKNSIGLTKTKINQLDLKRAQPQHTGNLRTNVKHNNGEQRILPLDGLQNKPVYVHYVKLANNQLQPVQVAHPGIVELNENLPQKHDKVVLSDANPDPQRTIKSVSKTSPADVDLDDVFLAVKTTKKYHQSRLQVLLDTWVSVAPHQVYFFTDADDEEFQQKTNGHMINTKCPSLHVRAALCCKMAAMFDNFIKSNKSWFCHVDDDNYLNLGELRKLLDLYQPDRQEVYLGRSSTTNPIEAYSTQTPMQKYHFWFATGGAGVCISRVLAKRMAPYVSGGKMLFTCDSIRMPDDVTIGYINEVLLNVPMVHIKEMNSHLQELWSIKPNDIKNQITLSYRVDGRNKIALSNPAFSVKDDPTRFKSIHCIVYPNSTICPDR